MDSIVWPIVWLACGVVTLIASVLASRSAQARYVGRAAVGVLFIFGGALLHVVNLATDGDYTGSPTLLTSPGSRMRGVLSSGRTRSCSSAC